jgi:hypothetical protein
MRLLKTVLVFMNVKRFVRNLSLIVGAVLLPWSGQLVSAFTKQKLANPVSVQMLSPLAGSTVSNTITLSASASSSAAPIWKVEFYMDDHLVGTVTNKIASPGNFQVVTK